MQLKDLKFIIVLSGFIGLLLSLYALLRISFSFEEGVGWRNVTGLILDIGVVLGSIAVFVTAKKLTNWSIKKITLIYAVLIFFCFAHDLVFLSMVHTIPGIIFTFILFLIHQYKKKNHISVEASHNKSTKA